MACMRLGRKAMLLLLLLLLMMIMLDPVVGAKDLGVLIVFGLVAMLLDPLHDCHALQACLHFHPQPTRTACLCCLCA